MLIMVITQTSSHLRISSKLKQNKQEKIVIVTSVQIIILYDDIIIPIFALQMAHKKAVFHN